MARFNLNTSWTKIASSGTTVEIQNLSSVGILIVTASSVPPPGVDGELLFGPASFRQYNLITDLYARSTTPTGAIVEVLDGFGINTGSQSTSNTSTGVAPVPAKAFADRSGTTSNTANQFTQLTPTNSSRVYLRIMNISMNGTIYVWDKVGTPYINGSMPIQPGSEREFTIRVSNTAIMIAGSIPNILFESAEA